MAFTPPIGTEEERNTGQVWPGTWVDATPYMTRYALGYHTGADLNNNRPRFDADAHAPVYSIGEGKVTYAQLVSKKYWGNLIVIDHGIVDGKPLFSRYGHIEAMTIKRGDMNLYQCNWQRTKPSVMPYWHRRGKAGHEGEHSNQSYEDCDYVQQACFPDNRDLT